MTYIMSKILHTYSITESANFPKKMRGQLIKYKVGSHTIWLVYTIKVSVISLGILHLSKFEVLKDL